ncbi:MAG: hypothetical protein GY813_02170 [Halieaceae bacterium]|nr:hypothetical protein [Halieaceae bacterium]
MVDYVEEDEDLVGGDTASSMVVQQNPESGMADFIDNDEVVSSINGNVLAEAGRMASVPSQPSRQAEKLGQAMGGVDVLTTGLEPQKALQYVDKKGVEWITGGVDEEVKGLLGEERRQEATGIASRNANTNEMSELVKHSKGLRGDLSEAATPEEGEQIKAQIQDVNERIKGHADRMGSGKGKKKKTQTRKQMAALKDASDWYAANSEAIAAGKPVAVPKNIANTIHQMKQARTAKETRGSTQGNVTDARVRAVVDANKGASAEELQKGFSARGMDISIEEIRAMQGGKKPVPAGLPAPGGAPPAEPKSDLRGSSTFQSEAPATTWIGREAEGRRKFAEKEKLASDMAEYLYKKDIEENAENRPSMAGANHPGLPMDPRHQGIARR